MIIYLLSLFYEALDFLFGYEHAHVKEGDLIRVTRTESAGKTNSL